MTARRTVSRAAVGAAVILEQHGYPPLLLDLESQDLLDHVIFVFRENGRWGSIARSRDIGLHGRKAVYRSLQRLALSYFDPFVDFSLGRLKGYGVTSLYDLGNYDWRFSPRKMTQDRRPPPRHASPNPSTPPTSATKNSSRAFINYKKRYPDRSPAITTTAQRG